MASRWQRIRDRLEAALKGHLAPNEVGLAVGIGTWVGCQPIFGLHLPLCIVLARRLQLNMTLLYGAANISNPIFAPFLVAAEIALGRWILGMKADGAGAEAVERPLWEVVKTAPDVLLACVIGGLVIGTLLSLLLGGVAWLVARWRLARAGGVPEEPA